MREPFRGSRPYPIPRCFPCRYRRWLKASGTIRSMRGQVEGPTMAASVEFAVVDVETTGPLPERYDRIIEIAVLRTDHQGRVIDEYCSLVNPNRDVGSTRIHGI